MDPNRDYSSFADYEFEPPPAIYRELYPVHMKYAARPCLNISSALTKVVVNQPEAFGSFPVGDGHGGGASSSSNRTTRTQVTNSLFGFESLIPVQSLKLTFSEINDCCPEICIRNLQGDLLFKGRFGRNFCCSCCECRSEDKEVFISDLNGAGIARLLFHSPSCRCFEETDFYEIFAPVRERVGTVSYEYNEGEQTFIIKNEISMEQYLVKRSIGENAHIKTVKGDVIAVVDINRPGRNIRPSYTLTFTHHAVTLVDKILLIGFLIAVDVLYLETTFIFQCIFIPCFSCAFALLVFLILYYKLCS